MSCALLPGGWQCLLHCCGPGLALVSCCCARPVQPRASPQARCKITTPTTLLWGQCEELRGDAELQLQGWLCRDPFLLLLSALQSGGCPFLLQAQPLLGLLPSPRLPFPAQRLGVLELCPAGRAVRGEVEARSTV